MTQVDFYVLQEADIFHRLHYACRLATKAFRGGHEIYLHTENEAAARQLDDMLWNFQAASFVPHAVTQDNLEEPVMIGWEDCPGAHNDVLINLSNQVPEFFSRFQRVSEIVIQEPDCRAASRENFKFYRDRGYPLQTHKF